MIQERIKIQVQGSEDYAHLDTYVLGRYLDDDPNPKKPLVLICPGGAYKMTSNREAEPIALQFNSIGYHAAVLRYSCKPAVYPTALLEVAKCVQFIREKGEEWGVDTEKILVMGFSAGGHLAASLGVFWNKGEITKALEVSAEEIRPNGMILSYPVITSGQYGHQESFRNLLGERYEELREKMSLENQVDQDTPRTFIWHTFEDTTVHPENSLSFVRSMVKYGVPVEYHLFPEGIHGIGLGNELTANPDGRGIVKACGEWSCLCEKWLNREFPWWDQKNKENCLFM